MNQETITPRKDLSAMDAKFEAQKLSFAPVAFQCARVLRENGILKAVADAGKEGITAQELHEKTGVSVYGVKVLLDMAASLYLVDYLEEEKYILMKTGYFVLNDKMSRINMDFVHDVCYKGLYHLDEAINESKPAGLKELGDWATIYEGLSKLPGRARESWFAFDHFYSDNAFPKALELVFDIKPKHLFDVGGNTGRWALECVKYDPDVKVTILDLPGQLALAKKTAEENGFEDRIGGHEINLLDDQQKFPRGADAIWMSQFLDCFSEEEILSILKRAAEAMDDSTRLFIMETFWDRQRFEAATYSLNATSLYFTVMANGNSRMYHSKDLIRQIHKAGLLVDMDSDDVGLGHTLLRCRKA